MEDILDFSRKRIARLRKENGISARDLSLSIGQNHAYINKIENGESNPTLVTIEYICQYFDISKKDFFDEEKTQPDKINQLIHEVQGLDKDTLELLTEIAKRFR